MWLCRLRSPPGLSGCRCALGLRPEVPTGAEEPQRGAVFLVLLQSLGDKTQTYKKDHFVRINPREKYFLG